MNRKYFIFLFFLLTISGLQAQPKFQVPDVYYEWNKLSDANISRHGDFISYEVNKLKGDGYLHIHQFDGRFHDSIARGNKAKFSPSGNFMAFLIEPAYDSIRQLKLDDVKKKKFPKDSLGIYFTHDQSIEKHARVSSFKVPEKQSDWIAWLHEKPRPKKEEKDTASADSLASDSIEKPDIKGKKLVITHPGSGFKKSFAQVNNYKFSKNGRMLIFTQEIKHKKQQDTSLFWIFDTKKQQAQKLFKKAGEIKSISTDRKGRQYAFVFSDDTTDVKDYTLHFGQEGELKMLADSSAEFLIKGWQISEYSRLSFSKNGERLLFETAPVPEPEPEDSLTDEEKYHVDIWHWQDKKLQPQQKKQKKRELRRDYLAFYQIDKEEFQQIENKKFQYAYILRHNNSRHAHAYIYNPYLRQRSWTGKRYRDVYYIDLKKEEKKKLISKHGNRISFSPDGKYMVFYSEKDSCWWSYDIRKDEKNNLTPELNINFFDPHHDTPNEPYAFGLAGWDKEGHVYAYDYHDIWKLDASGKTKPVNLTQHQGRKKNLRFRYIKTDKQKDYLPDTLLLSVFDYKTKAAGYARCEISGAADPDVLIKEDYRFYRPKKAKNAGKFIFRKSSFRKYPDLWTANKNFDTLNQISQANPQQQKYQWGNVELTNWTNADGDSLSGLVYKPGDFDPSKQYPMIVYFYETYSNHLHNHYIPKPSHSVINFTRYINDDYIIFIPDITYEEGYPGQSAEKAVISGTLHMIDKGYVDKEHIGMQGQSWGGYQVAHLATRTDLFSAAMAGAPVSNMSSAYGGIRWGSGMSRAFQYERTQSRIGKSLWKRPLHYIENSPLFHVPQVETPLLIMHNDNDGAVPYYQGIELFNALRRLNKTAYMLVYNNDSHNLRHWGNRIDLSIRMKQFFDHYLKQKPMPQWMKEGLPAVKKGKETGYELTD